jgi:hypothetical protein
MSIYNNTSPQVKRFIEYVHNLCDEHEVKLDIRHTNYVWVDGSRAGGFFDGDAPEMRVAGDSPNALHIFVHEFAHMTQWLDKKSIWYKTKLDHTKVDSWLLGNQVHHIGHIIDELATVEHDNELRSVQLIKKFRLPISIREYSRGANSYLYFYQHLKNTRKWCSPNNRPYMNREIIAVCPSKIYPNYDEYIRRFPTVQSVYEEQGI